MISISGTVSLLRHIIDEDGFRADPEKLQTIMTAKTPKSTTKPRSFLELAGYYRRFINGFAEISSGLYIGASVKFALHWNAKTKECFDQIK